MKIEIDRESKTPVYIQISDQLRRQIITGEIPAGRRLPSERKLAECLGVNRTTVLNAFEVLKSENLLEAAIGSGTVVREADREEETPAGTVAEPVWNQLFSRYATRLESGLVGDLLALASRRDVISFATGIASPDSGPAEILEGLEADVLLKENIRALLHSPTEGFLSLRTAMCALMQKRGVFCRPDEVMLLAGSQQGIDLASRIFIDPGDIVVLEEPTYFPAIQVFKAAGARIMTVPVDDQGMKVEQLEQLLTRYRPKLIYTVPTYQNPTGTEMTLERRRRLVELASRCNVVVLEDDAYGDLCYESGQQPLIKSLDAGGHVIYLSTFSKNVYSGLRLGWIVADKKIVRQFSSAKQLMDLHSSSLSQWLVERFVSSGAIAAHLKKVCVEYKERRDLMVSALNRYAPAGASWNTPAGGYYIWCRLPRGFSADRLVSKAAGYGVTFIPGRPFYVSGEGDDHIRLNFTYAPKNKIDDGVRLLCKAMRALLDEGRPDDDNASPGDISPIV
jgi:DNA-binding transcriptional MocR family regulator